MTVVVSEPVLGQLL